MKPKMFVVSQQHYFEPWEKIFERSINPAQADVLLFSGGSDVWPRMYGEKLGRFTSSDPRRDMYEQRIFELFPKAKHLGICRGAQFLCVMAGGKLVQHVTNHGRWHTVHVNKFLDPILMSSTHHQMMFPGKIEHELVGWTKGVSNTYLNGDNDEIREMHRSRVEPEMVYFPKTNSLCIQGHPEIMHPESRGVKACQQLVKKYLL